MIFKLTQSVKTGKLLKIPDFHRHPKQYITKRSIGAIEHAKTHK